MRHLITVADDFGLTTGVNEAVEQAARHGILTSASLMVSAPAAEDAVARARALSQLAVGLHVVVIEGAPTLPPEMVPDLVGLDGRFPSDQLRMGMAYFCAPRVRRQLAAEIRAQFAAFAATGLVLDHANAHKHMHLHPTVGRLVIAIGQEFGLRAVRVPAEPAIPDGPVQRLGDRVLRRWCGVLRRQVHRAGMIAPDQVFGLGWTGHMTPMRTQKLLDAMPEGLTEMYFHPATIRDGVLAALMPDYEHAAEHAALLQCRMPQSVNLTRYSAAIASEKRHSVTS